MTKQRTVISKHPTHDAAWFAKEVLLQQEGVVDADFQIRRTSDGFNLVQREEVKGKKK